VIAAVVPAVGLGVSGSDTQGERLTYLASAFAAITIASVLVQALDRRAPRRLRAAAAATIGLLAVGGAIWTSSLDARWADAGRLSAALTRDAPWRGTHARVVVVITPDDLAGAYVDRNALGAGTVLLEGGTGARVTNMVPARYAGVLDQVTVTPIGRRAWSLRLTDPAAAVLDASDGLPWFPVRGIDVRRIDRRAVAVHLDPTIDPSEVWYVSNGSAHHLAG
jgi:hypothetical protein